MTAIFADPLWQACARCGADTGPGHPASHDPVAQALVVAVAVDLLRHGADPGLAVGILVAATSSDDAMSADRDIG